MGRCPGGRGLAERRPPNVRRAIEAAAGMVERAIRALSDPAVSDGSANLSSQLRGSGYRPMRIRPYRVGSTVLVAAVWTRDGRSWQWLGDADVEQAPRNATPTCEGKAMYRSTCPLPSWRDGSPPSYTAVWEQADVADTEVRLIVGRHGEHGTGSTGGRLSERNSIARPLRCRSRRTRADRTVVACGPGGNLSKGPRTRFFHDLAAHFREDDCPGLLLTDAQLSWSRGQGRRQECNPSC